jgi:hypothetical protein
MRRTRQGRARRSGKPDKKIQTRNKIRRPKTFCSAEAIAP